ncbi:MAG: hypothetical protein KBC73_18980 [Burkholderiaceae bacterium]|nr:hypothetical protein [Burkholderiaceae bacterium]
MSPLALPLSRAMPQRALALSAPLAWALALLAPAPSAWALGVSGSHGVIATVASLHGGGEYHAEAEANLSTVNTWGVASGSLSDGALHAYAWSSNNPTLSSYCKPYMLSCNWGISADVYMWDTLTLKAGAQYQAGQKVKYEWDAHGTWGNGRWWTRASAMSWFYAGTNPQGYNTQAVAMNLKTGGDTVLRGAFEVPADGSSYTVYIYGALSVHAEGGAWADYSQTSRFHIELPPGVEMVSASGRFMSEHLPTTPVPEPATATLWLAGLLGLSGLSGVSGRGAWARRRTARLSGR